MRLILAFALASALVGCNDSGNGGNGDGGAGHGGDDMTANAPVPTNFDSINSQVLKFSCEFSTCHVTTNARNAGNLDFQTTSKNDAYQALVNVAVDNPRAKAEGQVRVKPCDAQHSFLVYKLTQANPDDPSDATHYGERMPAGSDPLDPAVIQAIEDWINRGALKDEPVDVKGSTCTLADGGA